MKTRKYKDQKQRTNFVQYESQNILIQYCKKIKVPSRWSNHPKEDTVKSLILPPSLLSSSELDIQALSKTPFGTQHYKNKGTFQYPSKLSAIFNEYPLFKSLHFVAHLQRNCKQGHTKSGSMPANAHDLTEGCLRLMARRIAYNMCYLKKTKPIYSKVRIRGRCIQSNRPRSVSRLLRLSRIRIRSLALNGKITGCTRSTW